jgi:hypothetical protein
LLTLTRPTHEWLRQIRFTHVGGASTPLLDDVVDRLGSQLRTQGHRLQAEPNNETDIILSTAPFGEPVGWRDAMLFTSRRRWNLTRTPTSFSLIHATPCELDSLLEHFDRVLAKDPPDPADYDFPGLAPQAFQTLIEQGRRGGPIMAVERLLQARSKSIRIVLIVGEDRPLHAYYFDLVGAYPRVDADDEEFFYHDMALRMVTSVSTGEVTQHSVAGNPVRRSVWDKLSTPEAMRVAGRELGRRNFFTEMVRIADLVSVPALADAVAVQYSEGCFATWDPQLGALIATVTGSARPVEKENITSDELAVIIGVRPDGLGAVVRHVEDKRNDPPSSEAVEMILMDRSLPSIELDPSWNAPGRVPVVRSKLHGHRGVGAYDPRLVEFVPLDAPFYHYPVSCATEAQALAINAAFGRSRALLNPTDPRQVVFTVLPGHGIVIAEKWVSGTAPFQTMWDYMDAGALRIENGIPQGPMDYVSGGGGLRIVREL